MTRRYSYDTRCAALATLFLADFRLQPAEREVATKELAQDIHDAIANHFAEHDYIEGDTTTTTERGIT